MNTEKNNLFADSYKLKAMKHTGGGVGISTFYNLELGFTGSKRARVTGVYNERVDEAAGLPISECQGSDSWLLSHR